MINNMGVIDRVVRILLAILIVVLYFMGQITGVAAIVLGIIAVIFMITSCLGYCPIYQLLKVTTKGK